MLKVIDKINVFIQDLLNNMCILGNLGFVMNHLCEFLRITVEQLIELYIYLELYRYLEICDPGLFLCWIYLYMIYFLRVATWSSLFL